MPVLGLQARSYLNTGTLAAPVRDEIGPVKNETVNLDTDLADVTTRNSNGWRLQLPTLKNGTVDLQLQYEPDDPDFQAFKSAFENNTDLLIDFLDGDVAVSGTYRGVSAAWRVSNFTENRDLEDALTIDVTLVPKLEAVTNTAPSFISVVTP